MGHAVTNSLTIEFPDELLSTGFNANLFESGRLLFWSLPWLLLQRFYFGTKPILDQNTERAFLGTLFLGARNCI